MKCPFCKDTNFAKLTWLHECANNCGYYKSNFLHRKINGYNYEFVLLRYDNKSYLKIMNICLKNKKWKSVISIMNNEGDVNQKAKYELNNTKINFGVGTEKLIKKIKKYFVYV